ncbi:hypothetical protein OUZ56_029351 [Daphnia magna]|uniref:C2H2-type domain-containing protein n=1 Tax=Daphnia magna TaxID=35525 RepID=A0ABR0B6J6_9CRUS|nr:hypothetical protein OUZ56_029351 [Daphnia magna]
MVENYLAREIDLLEEVEVLNERVDNVISRAQHDELLRKNKLLWIRLRARRVRRSLPLQEVDSSPHCDQLDDMGLIPLSESQLQDIRAKNSSCVRFIGSLVQASFPNGYFDNRMPEHVTKGQFKRLYEITSAHFTKIKRARRNAVKLSLKEVVNVIRTYIYNARNRKKKRISSFSSTESEYSTAEFSNDDLPNDSGFSNNTSNTNVASGNFSKDNVSQHSVSSNSVPNDGISNDGISNDGISNDGISNDGISNNGISSDSVSNDTVSKDSVSNDTVSKDSVSNDDGFNENDTDNDYCDRPCDPPNHYPDCKNFTGVVHVDGKCQLYAEFEWARLHRPKESRYYPKFAIGLDKSNPKQPKYLQSKGETNGSAGVCQCNVCDKIFSSKNAVARHKLIHTDPLTWKKCPFCEYRACDISNLRKHTSKKHKEDKPNRLTCDICHKKLANTRNLDRHKQKIHHS